MLQFTAAGSALAWQVSIAPLLANFNMLATLENMVNIKLYYNTTRVAATRCAAPHRVAMRHVARPQNDRVAHLHGDAQHHHPLQHHDAQPQDERRDLFRRARGHERARDAAFATRRAASTLPRRRGRKGGPQAYRRSREGAHIPPWPPPTPAPPAPAPLAPARPPPASMPHALT